MITTAAFLPAKMLFPHPTPLTGRSSSHKLPPPMNTNMTALLLLFQRGVFTKKAYNHTLCTHSASCIHCGLHTACLQCKDENPWRLKGIQSQSTLRQACAGVTEAPVCPHKHPQVHMPKRLLQMPPGWPQSTWLEAADNCCWTANVGEEGAAWIEVRSGSKTSSGSTIRTRQKRGP